MGRLNNYIKALILHATTWFSIVGISFIALAIFVLVSDWGSLDEDFFLGWSILIIFFGFFLFLTSMVGYMGVRFQRKRIGNNSPAAYLLVLATLTHCLHARRVLEGPKNHRPVSGDPLGHAGG